MRQVELLAPAGDAESLAFALAYGADAVYVGAKEFGMRAASANFTDFELFAAAEETHRRGKLLYLTLNTLPTNEEMDRLPNLVQAAADAVVDAFIVADLGVLETVKRVAPGVDIHFSTQGGIANWVAAEAAYRLGASRVVLARELCLEDIAEIRKKAPAELELEVFVHGAMCMSVSGRCLLSSYLTGRDAPHSARRDANRGACAQSCRWSYALVEQKRRDEAYEIGEADGFSYILSADDLCAAPFLGRVLEAGATSLKIEGRAKSFYYVASATAAYRKALDAALAARGDNVPFICPDFTLAELGKTSHRPFSSGFFLGKEGATQSPWQEGYIRRWRPVAVVEETLEGRAFCKQRGKFCLGDELEALTPGGRVYPFAPAALWDENGGALETTPHTKMSFSILLPEGLDLPPLSILRKKAE